MANAFCVKLLFTFLFASDDDSTHFTEIGVRLQQWHAVGRSAGRWVGNGDGVTTAIKVLGLLQNKNAMRNVAT